MIIQHRGFIVSRSPKRADTTLTLIWIGVPAAWALLLFSLIHRIFS